MVISLTHSPTPFPLDKCLDSGVLASDSLYFIYITLIKNSRLQISETGCTTCIINPPNKSSTTTKNNARYEMFTHVIFYYFDHSFPGICYLLESASSVFTLSRRQQTPVLTTIPS